MGMLEEMYYGKLECQERTRCNKELIALSKLCDRNREKLLSTMTDEQKLLFEKFLDCNDELHCYKSGKVSFKVSNSVQNLQLNQWNKGVNYSVDTFIFFPVG